MTIQNADLAVKIADVIQQVTPVTLINANGEMIDGKRLSVQTLLNGVSATGASSAVDLSDYNNAKLQIIKTGTATVDVEESLDGTNWSTSLSDQNGIVSIGPESFSNLRVNVSARTSGTITVYLIASN